jgi:two-component system response regulator DegU
MKRVLHDLQWITVVGEAGDEPGLLDGIQPEFVDVILVDVLISETTDPHLIQRLRKLADHLYVIALTTEPDFDQVKQALRAGAEGVLLRSADSATFVDAIRKGADGYHYIQPELAVILVGLSGPSSGQVIERLSARQLLILRLMTHGSRNQQIAREMGISETTVKSELRVTYAELGASNRAEAAAIAIRTGLIE